MRTSRGRYLAISCLVALGVAGCSGGIDGDFVVNAPPDTEVTQTPPVLGQTSFEVTFFWTGTDRDGEVEFFEWRISDNGPDGILSVADTLGLPWNATATTDSTFTVNADLDSFALDVDDPKQDDGTYRYWQTHTFFIRAVDDEGSRDPEPAMVSFTATTLAPTVRIDLPEVGTDNCTSSARVLRFEWTGFDQDNVIPEPTDVRYILYDLDDLEQDLGIAVGSGCMTRQSYNSNNPLGQLSRDDPRWSDWIDYNAAQDEGRAVTLPRQEVGKRFLFALQARDVAGAVTPTFRLGRNVMQVRISNSKRPLLTVNERFLGQEQFAAPVRAVVKEIVAGQPLEFRWSATAAEYAGVIEAYRYGWNVADVNDPDDDGWEIQWGRTDLHTRSPVRTFFEGSPNFVVQVRDNSGTVNTAVYQFSVLQIPELSQQRGLLLVDDWITNPVPEEQELEALWDQRWLNLLQDKIPSFDPTLDIIDLQEFGSGFGFREASQYRGIIWFTNSNDNSYLHRTLAPLDDATTQFNWLEVYQARVGNLLLTGPLCLRTSLENRQTSYMYPVVFDIPDIPPFGFDTDEGVGGVEFNVGTTRWPYTGFCLEAIDHIRPPNGEVRGEPLGNPRRTTDCDRMMVAEVDEDFLINNPSAAGLVDDLQPSSERLEIQTRYLLNQEEFYNAITTPSTPRIDLRPCQEAMFGLLARRDAVDPRTGGPFIAGADTVCVPWRAPRSTLDGVPVAIGSSTFGDTKPLTGARDWVWGFHPLAFRARDVQSALLWVVGDDWRIPVQR